MKRFSAVSLVAVGVLVMVLASVALGMNEPPRPVEPPDYAVGRLPAFGPFVIVQQGGTTWVQVHTDTTNCPGDEHGGHGGEAKYGPDGSETWCFENATWVPNPEPDQVGNDPVTVSDSCGTNSPWDTRCFTHVDLRAQPSLTDLNFWHLDSHRTFADSERPGPDYTGNYALWCGSEEIWIDGYTVECGTWEGEYPGYGNRWNCVAQLELSGMSAAGICTLGFDPRYDTECKYDYFYVDYFDGSGWVMLGLFNGASNSSQAECGFNQQDNPDYYGFGDSGQPNSAQWVARDGSPRAFLHEFAAAVVADPPKFRWRFVSDPMWSDADGRGNSDGACFIDNVVFWAGPGNRFEEDFEHNNDDTLAAHGWTYPDPDPVAQCWHQIHDVDPPYEGNEPGKSRSTCSFDSSVVWRARPDKGYPTGQAWRTGWWYRLLAPEVDIPAGAGGTGCVVQYDHFICGRDVTCDYTDTKVRFYDLTYDRWCPWINIDDFVMTGGCTFWNFGDEEDVTRFYGATASKMQFSWEILDRGKPGQLCYGKHGGSENVVDNVSIGFYDGTATMFVARHVDMFQDSFHDSIGAYNSLFAAYETDTLDKYNVRGGTADPLYRFDQLYVSVTDKDDLQDVRLYGSIDGGDTWVWKDMTQDTNADPQNPDFGGEFYGTFYPADFPGQITREGFWPKGIELWYYVRAEDMDARMEYWPSAANPSSPAHTGGRKDFAPSFLMSILPLNADNDTRILLVDGYPRAAFDWAECMARDDSVVTRVVDIYKKTLQDVGYCFDEYNIHGGGSSAHIHPLQYTDYSCVFWFTGPYFSEGLVDEEAQESIRDYLAGGGKVVLAGDLLAYSMADQGAGGDSLGGEFLADIMGCEYIGAVEDPFEVPYILLEAEDSVDVFGVATAIELDSLLVYRECPTMREMSYVQYNVSPDSGYVVQPLLYLPDAGEPREGAIYVEYLEVGQCVFVNYDFSAFATHRRTPCSGTGGPGTAFPPYEPASYHGRVDLVEVILRDLFDLVPPFPGGGAVGVPTRTEFKWALGQNYPNPARAGTEIRFEIARTSNVSIKVYNAMGQLVRTLENKRLDPGRYSSRWDGTNSAGQRVSSGVYFYRMEAGQFGDTKKMLLVR